MGSGCDCIPELVKQFGADAVVKLYESWECGIDIPEGVEVYEYPICDSALSLLKTY